LSGLGGDEATGGYSHFRLLRALRVLAWADHVPPALRRGLLARMPTRGLFASPKARELLGPDGPRDAVGLSWLQRRLFTPDDVAALTGSADQAPRCVTGGGRSARELSRAELETYLQGMLLPDADAYSMASSVELRVPLVDAEFLRVALAVDPLRGIGKRGFARMLGEPLLIAATARPKQGFTVPMGRWMRDGALRPLVAALADEDAPVWQYLDQKAGLAIVERWRRGGRWAEAWAIAVLNAWLADLSTGVPSVSAMAAPGPDADGGPACAG
jgi:asparagine synthase (glutamine-hydrolysing)